MSIKVKEIEIIIGNVKRGDIGEYVGRPSVFGNPFPVSLGREEAIEKYRKWLREKIEHKDKKICYRMNELLKKAKKEKKLTLVCWCFPFRCHAEVIADELARAILDDFEF